MRIYGLTQRPTVKRQRQREAARYAIELERIQQIKAAIIRMAESSNNTLPLRFFVIDNTICLVCESVRIADLYLTKGILTLAPGSLPRVAGEWHLMTLYCEGGGSKVLGFPLPIGRITPRWHGQPVNPRPILENAPTPTLERTIAQEVTRLLVEAKIDGEVPIRVEGQTICIKADCKFEAEYLMAIASQLNPGDLDGWSVQGCFDQDGQEIVCGVPVAIGRGGAGNWWDLPPWHFT